MSAEEFVQVEGLNKFNYSLIRFTVFERRLAMITQVYINHQDIRGKVKSNVDQCPEEANYFSFLGYQDNTNMTKTWIYSGIDFRTKIMGLFQDLWLI